MAKLTRDQRLIVCSQHACGDSMKTIAKRNGFSRSQVRYACRDDVNSTPQKDKSGRPPKLPIHGLDNVRSWIGESPERRCKQICQELDLPICAKTHRVQLKKRGTEITSGARTPSTNTLRNEALQLYHSSLFALYRCTFIL